VDSICHICLFMESILSLMEDKRADILLDDVYLESVRLFLAFMFVFINKLIRIGKCSVSIHLLFYLINTDLKHSFFEIIMFNE
jgi:hypothetical protein